MAVNNINSIYRIRKNFGTISSASIPNLIEIQKRSYVENFLRQEAPDDESKKSGLDNVFSSVFPIQDPTGAAVLEYIGYDLDEPKFEVDECVQRGLTYSAPLKVTLRLSVWDVDEDTAAREIRGIKEQEVYIGDIPLMTKNGTFIINGTERVVVSQTHRSPGVFFYHDDGKSHSSGKFIYSARIIPYRGSWLDFEFDAKDILYFRIDRKRKLPISSLLLALGLGRDEILQTYYSTRTYQLQESGWVGDFNPAEYAMQRLDHDLVNAETGEVALEVGQKISPRIAKKLASVGLKKMVINEDQITARFLGENIFGDDAETPLFAIGDEITPLVLDKIVKIGLKKITILKTTSQTEAYIRNSLYADKNSNRENALIDIFKVLRPGEPATFDAGQDLFQSLFFDPDRYDLSEVGRVKINARLELDVDEENHCLVKDDIIKIVEFLVDLKNGKGMVDDIDHLSNRRVRSVGELVENQFRLGLVRMEKSILERMSAVEIDTVMPHDLISSKVLVTAIKDFFSSSQLSQFMDQTNPLSEITHKRRLSALGPGGVSRDRVVFEVRDVHASHYGRICPIETPEGQNIGLINSLATYARVNKHGFIESPYRVVENGFVTDEIKYLSAIEEGKFKITQANIPIAEDGKIMPETVSCRTETGNYVIVPPSEVDFIDVTPMQVVSVAASLIPFLENDDANRALMGSNMQRQAVPLVQSDAPLIGTGIENVVAKDSGAGIVAINDGVVESVDSTRIVIRNNSVSKGSDSPAVDIYNLLKFQKSNYNTCINQKPLVSLGASVKAGEVIADGPAIDRGEIALGRNVLVAFIPWNGYNFEDSILISERIVRDDVFTSVHIEEFEIVARDTRLGPEEITRDMPNVSEEALSNLDEVGIVNIGAEVKPGDILVGKVTPKSESPMTPEEKLLRAIFGEKASEVRDSSLYVPPGVSGTVVEVRVFSRRGIEKDERSLAIEREQITRLAQDRDDEIAIMDNFVFMRVKQLLNGQKALSGPKSLKAGAIIDEKMLDTTPKSQYWSFTVEDHEVMQKIEQIKDQYEAKKSFLNKRFDKKIAKIKSGDDLPQGALKVVKVFIATKHKLQPGDKMAGRHGNKGVVSRIMPEEDMPFLEDGTVIDVVLNPLGLPSRMNVGQILETHLGWAAKNLGKKVAKEINSAKTLSKDQITSLRKFVGEIYTDKEIRTELDKMDDKGFLDFCHKIKDGVHFATPVFDGARIGDVKDMLELSGQDKSGQSRVIDGRTGEYFDRNITVGYKYILKLHHLVDDKIHARSIGPYSLVTQQPLGGKSHFGGQRFGEMECWALQAYGAAYTLQEMLTVKSDDVAGRIKIYESIVKGDQSFDSGIPESFNVMIKEFRSLCLNVRLENSEDMKEEAN